jgi:hypothetical protein
VKSQKEKRENYERDLAIAKIVYRDLEAIIEKYQSHPSLKIKVKWTGAISIGKSNFMRGHLEEKRNEFD